MKHGSGFSKIIEAEEGMLIPALLLTSPKLAAEPLALSQLRDACRIPGVEKVIATPDIHPGYGVPIGSVIGTRDVVIPAAVGYDINCGMRMLTTDLVASEADVPAMASSVRRDVPLGEGKRNVSMEREDFLTVLIHGLPALTEVRTREHPVWEWLDESEEPALWERIEAGGSMPGRLEGLSARAIQRGRDQLGTLGGGNHFIEFQEVMETEDHLTATQWGIEAGRLVIMIHSGSRGFGHQVGDEYMDLARSITRGKGAPNRDLCYLPLNSREGEAYIGAMHAGANLAFANRHLLGVLAKKAVIQNAKRARVDLLYDVPHNIAKFERHEGKDLWVHRKGATRAFSAGRMKGTPFAKTGQPVLIPGSMGSASYLLAGIPDNEYALASANHGAGRRMSRTQAAGKVRRRDGKRVKSGLISDDEFNRAMNGVMLLCENRFKIKEEAPQAYKDIDSVMEVVRLAKLGRVVARMRPLAVLKG